MRRRSCRRSAIFACSAGAPSPLSAPAKPRSPAAASPPSSRCRSARRASSSLRACRVDQIYPPQNAVLRQAIAALGLLLAEAPFGTPPVARAFPRRNRIVSGLSAGIVVVEAAARSGSLITAQYAAEQGREVFVVPGSPMDPRHAGSNALIRGWGHSGA